MKEKITGSPKVTDFTKGVFGGGNFGQDRSQDYPGEYTGGTPTRPYSPTVGTQALLPEQDFSEWELKRKRQQEWSRTVGRARELERAADYGLPLQDWERTGPRRTPAEWTSGPAAMDFLNRRRREQAAALEAEWNGGQQQLPMDHPVLTRIIDDARKQGIDVTPADIRNLTNLGVLDMAANQYNKWMRAGNARGAANVLITLQQSSPQMAALLPLYAQQKEEENNPPALENPGIVEEAIAGGAEWALTSWSSPLKWAIEEWETFQNGIRAGQWQMQQNAKAPTDGSVLGGIRQDVMSGVGGLFQGIASPDAWAATAPGLGAFNKDALTRVQQKYAVGDDIIDIAMRIADDVNNGRPDTIIDVLTSEGSTDEQVRFATDVLQGKTTLSAFDAVGLIDEVRFTDQSNIGRMVIGEYAQDMSSEGKYLASDLTSLAVGFADPLMFVGAPIRAVTASRYAIAKLAPGLARADYATALASRKVAGVETNRARRYFEGLLRDLDALDELEPGSVKSSVARQRIVENYDMLPEDVIWGIANTDNVAKVNIGGKTVRTVDGVSIDGDRVAPGFIDFLYEENTKWLVTMGQASVRAKKAGEASLISQATAGSIMDGLDHATALKVAREGATPEMLREARRVQQGVLMKDMRAAGQPMASRFVQRGRRDPVIPYRGIIGDARRRAVNSVVLGTMSTKRTDELVDTFIKSFEPEDLAKALDEDTMGAIPRADRQIFPRTDEEGFARPLSGVTGAVIDRGKGMFSSMPNSLFINTATGENAQQVYLYARQFHTRQTAAFIADKFRTAGGPDASGVRRRILAGLIRSTAASRALKLTDEEVQALIGDMATGSKRGEMFAIPTPAIPSAKMLEAGTPPNPATAVPSARTMQATLQEAERQGKNLAKEQKKLARAQADLDQANARLATATAANDEKAIAALQRDVRRLTKKAERHGKNVDRQMATVEAYKKRLVKALRATDRLRPDEVAQRLPIDIQAKIQAQIDEAVAGPNVTPAMDDVAARQQVLADDGTLIDDVAEQAAPPGTPAPEAQQVALDAQGMTPVPEQMTGARMTEMPFDEADEAARAEAARIAEIERQAKEAADGLPALDEFMGDDPDMAIMAGWLKQFQGQPYDEATEQMIRDTTEEIGARWAYQVLGDERIRKGYLRHLGLDQDVIPDEYVRKYGAEYDKFVDETPGDTGWASRAMSGAVDPHAVPAYSVMDTSIDAQVWRDEGAITRARLMDMIDEYGEEGAWAWWKTGNPESYLYEGFFDLHGPAPRLLPDPGKGPMAIRRAARIPGEYTSAAMSVNINARAGERIARKLDRAKQELGIAQQNKNADEVARLSQEVKDLQKALNEARKRPKQRAVLRVPWAGTKSQRDDYIREQYDLFSGDAIEEALAGRSVESLATYMDMLRGRLVTAADDVAEDVAVVADDVVEDVLPLVDEVVDEAPIASPVPASEDVIEGTVLNRVDEPVVEAAAPPAGGPPRTPVDTPSSPLPEPAGPGLPSTREIEVWLNKYRSEYQSPIYALDDEMVYSPSRDAMGREHAVNLYQTSDWAVLPSMAQIESMGFFGSNPLGRALHQMAQRPTDLWSLMTLYGFRFAQRSAVEDLLTYLLTGGAGRVGDLYRGRRGSQAMRWGSAKARVEPRKGPGGQVLQDENGQPIYDIIVPKNEGARLFKSTSRLGMTSRWFRKLGDQIQKSNIESFQGFILPNISEDKLLMAIAEQQRGNYMPMRAVIAEAAGRMKFTGLSDDDIRALQDLGGTHAGIALMNDIAEAGAYINSGNYRSLAGAMNSLADHPDIEWVSAGRPVYFGDYKRLALSANAKEDPYATAFWHRKLQAIVRDDGPIGAIFIKLMHEPDRAKKAIADAIRKDKRMGYKERFSLISNDASIDDFAHRYYEASLVYFQRADGTINESLRSTFIDTWTDPKNGRERMRIAWTRADGRGREFLRATSDDLRRFDRNDKPMYALGRGSTDIPMPTTDKALFDRAWDWMGEQYARIAREPIFIGNYLANRRALKAAGLEDRFAQGFANARAGVDDGAKILDTDRELARQVVSKQAMDSAYAFSLNYMDNPNNRSVLAWKVRNFSRYYRATEDFARRAYRLAVNYPDAYLKLAITYQVLDDTGFTYRDSNGDLYFAYPMNGFLQDALSTISGLFPGLPMGLGVGADPFMVGGKVKNISPSTDPAQWAPTIVGPVGTVPLVGLFNMFPSMQGLRALTLGEYSSAGQTGSFVGDIVDSVVPAGAKRFWSLAEPGERDSAIGSSMVGAMASMYADGTLDDVLDPETGMLTLDQLKQNDIYGEATKRALGIQLTKMIFGYGAPASPQVYQNNISDVAREMGFDGMSDVFHALIDKNDGDITAAYIDWQRMDPDGRLTPFTTSKTKDNPDKLASLAKAQPVAGLAEWARDDKVKDLAKKFPDSYMFLAPRTGDFDWSSWALVKASGFRVDKTVDEMMIDMFAAQGEAMDRQVLNAYEAEIAKYDQTTEAGRSAVRALEEQRSNDRNAIENMNPYWATKRKNTISFYSMDRLSQSYLSTQNMLTYLEEQDGELTGTAKWIKNAMDVWLESNVVKDGISSSTEAGRAERARMNAELEEALSYIGQQDPGAQKFIETVLSSSQLFNQLKG
jgi:hypothetical protein